ncbi:MAG: hypothetical protein ABFS86_16635 [Planctomycetota bacterium]
MSDENGETLPVAALRASLRLHASREGLTCEDRPAPAGGLRAVLAPASGEGEMVFAAAPASADHLSLSLVLVVDRDFFGENPGRILDVTSRYGACVSISGDGDPAGGGLGEDEAFLNLTLRIFTEGWNRHVFAAALRTLRSAKDGLAEEFA